MIEMKTERLIIRNYLETDLEDLHRLLSNHENMYYLDDITTTTIEETAENLSNAIKNPTGRYFDVCNKVTGEYIGSVGYSITDDTPIGKIVHMGYFLLPEYHNLGYTTEAVKRVISFAFETDNCIRITTVCYADNVPSRKVMEKVGFRKEGERIKAQWHDGKMKDRLDYAILSENFS